MLEAQSITPSWTLEYQSDYMYFLRNTVHPPVCHEGAKLTLPIPKDPKQETNLEGTPGSHDNASYKEEMERQQRHFAVQKYLKTFSL